MTTATSHDLPSVRAAHPAIPMARLVAVELRKMVDTRSGRWLLISIGGLVALVMAIILATANDPDIASFANLFKVAQLPVSIILPVLGVLAATSEWSQRTVLGTFSLVPSRGRVLAAKVLASLVLATGAALVSIVIAAVAAVIAPAFTSVNADWNPGISNVGEALVYQWLCMLLGVALGTAFLNSALAIVLYFALPTIWSGITSAIKGLNDLQPWLDTAPAGSGSSTTRR